MVGPPWFPIGVGVVMLAGFPTRLDPSSLFVVLVADVEGVPKSVLIALNFARSGTWHIWN